MPGVKQIVHLGLGAFHRAHQAVYMQALLDQGMNDWRLLSGNLRDDMPETIAALINQGGRYTLETSNPAGTRSYKRISSISEILPYQSDLAPLMAAAAPATKIISFTVTEAGYNQGSLLFHVLTQILRLRMQKNAGPVTLLCCDNFLQNGIRFRAGLLHELEAEKDLYAWVQKNTSSPCAMVDRITPRALPEVAVRVKATLGIDDPASLMAEEYIQWVIEDHFIAGRPAWEAASVQLVEDVTPYEDAKIRILNGSHVVTAWAGSLFGDSYIHQSIANPTIKAWAYAYVTDTVIPCLGKSPVDLPSYRDLIYARFANPAIADTNQRVAMDGFSKLPTYIMPTFAQAFAKKMPILAVARVPALFFLFLNAWDQGKLPFTYQDQAMDERTARAFFKDKAAPSLYCQNHQLFGELAGNAEFQDAVNKAIEDLKPRLPSQIASL